MLISKSKSTLLKSIAMIVTILMVVCVCLTACADNDARDAAKEAKEIAEKAQSSLDSSLKDYVKKDEVAKMIEDALKEFAKDGGKDMVIGVLKTDEGSKVISDAVSAALGNKLEGLQNEQQVKDLIDAALSGDSDVINNAIKDAMSDYVTAEAAGKLVSDALDGYFETIKPAIGDEIDAALEAYKTVVSDLIKTNIGDEVATYLNSEEAQALIEACINKYQADGLQNAVEATAKIVSLKNTLENNHWTSEDLAAINAVYNDKIAPMFDGAEAESDLVQQMYLLLTVDRLTLNANVAAFEEAINACESLEQAAEKIDAKIEELGKDINGDISSAVVNGLISADPTQPGKFGYVVVVTPEGVQYYTTGNLAKLGEDKGDATVYEGFNLIVSNFGDDTMNYFSYVVNDNGEWSAVEAEAVIAPVLGDEEAVAEIAADIQAMVDKFGKDHTDIRTTIPAVPDDNRTAEDESVPERYVYNPACGAITNAELFADYQDMLNTIRTSASNVLRAIEAFNTRLGDGKIPADAKDWPEYQKAVDEYSIYEACRFDNVVDGVEEAYSEFLKAVNTGVAEAEAAAREEQLKAWVDAYNEELKNLDRLYFAHAQEKLPEIIHYAAIFNSPIYGTAFTTEESVELMEWAKNYCENYMETMAYELVKYEGTIDSEEKFNQVLADLRKQFEGFNNDLDDIVAEGGPVETALYEIDAKYWYDTVKARELKRLATVLEASGFKPWDTTETNDLYDIANKYVQGVIASVNDYKINNESKTPYTDGVTYFINVLKYPTLAAKQADTNADPDAITLEDILRPMEIWYDTQHSVFDDKKAAPVNVAVADYKSYKSVKLDELDALKATLMGEFTPADATDDFEYAHYKNMFETTCANEVSAINRVVVVDGDYAGAIAAMDAQYTASARELQKDVYEMKIDRFAVSTEQQVNAILNNNYKTGVGAELFAEYYPQLVAIVNEYNQNIIPSRTLENSYADDDVDKVNDEVAFNNAMAAIAKDYDDVQRKLANVCFGNKLIDEMEKLEKAVNEYHAKAVADVEDTYGFLAAIKEQIDAIVAGDAILDDASIESSTTAYIDEYKALYDAKLAEINAAIANYKTLLAAAIDATNAVNEAKTDAIDASQKLYDKAVEDLGDYDYKKILSNNLNALKRNVGDVVMVRPSHKENVPNTDPVEQVDVYDDIDETNLAAARSTALTAIEELKTAYANSLADYVTEMEAYKAQSEKLEERKAAIVARINAYLATYENEGSGRFVESDAEIYWSVVPAIFEKDSPLHLGMLKAIDAVNAVELVMDKGDGEFYTAEEAYANAVARATYSGDSVTAEGGALWKALADNIPDQKGATNFVATINRQLLGK